MGWVQAGLAIASTAASLFGGRSERRERKKVAQLQASLTFDQRMEELRKARREMSFLEGDARGRAFASNLQMTGSTRNAIQDIYTEHARQLNFYQDMARRERDLIRRSGQSPGANIGMIGTAASGISRAISGWNENR